MNSERQKRQEEVERILREAGESHEADVAFQEEVRRTAAAIIEKEASRIQKNEQAERRKRPINPFTAGVWLLVVGAAAYILSMPSLATVLFLCAIALIAWVTFLKPSKSSPLVHWNIRSYKRILKKTVSRLFKRTS
jgi:hypothetical protein